jgi:hypothetical protein
MLHVCVASLVVQGFALGNEGASAKSTVDNHVPTELNRLNYTVVYCWVEIEGGELSARPTVHP